MTKSKPKPIPNPTPTREEVAASLDASLALMAADADMHVRKALRTRERSERFRDRIAAYEAQYETLRGGGDAPVTEAPVTDAPPPKRSRGRPRVHADAHAARQAARERATAHTQARRKAKPERTIAMTPARVAQGEAIIRSRGLDGWSHLVSVLIEDETRRRDGDL